jgi:hypothetical protein
MMKRAQAMMRRANIQIVSIPKRRGRQRGDWPPLGLSTSDREGTTEAERDRVAREAGKATLLLSKAKQGQRTLLERLARDAGEDGIKFPTVGILERFLAATAKLDAKAAAALPDDQVAALWREVGGTSPGQPQRVPIPHEALMRLRSKGKPGAFELDTITDAQTPPEERERIAQDAHVGRIILEKATSTQRSVLERFVKCAGERGLRFAFVAQLARFLGAVHSLQPKVAAKLSDDDLAALWRDANR